MAPCPPSIPGIDKRGALYCEFTLLLHPSSNEKREADVAPCPPGIDKRGELYCKYTLILVNADWRRQAQ